MCACVFVCDSECVVCWILFLLLQFLLLNILWRHITDYDQTLNYSFTIVIRLLYTYITYTTHTHSHTCIYLYDVSILLYTKAGKFCTTHLYNRSYITYAYWIKLLGASDGLKWVLTGKMSVHVLKRTNE